MEEQSSFESFESSLTSQAKDYLKESGKWCKFLSIMGFIGIGLMVLAGVFMGFAGSLAGMNQMSNLPSTFPTAILSMVYIVMALIYFFPVYYLYKYSVKIIDAVNSNDSNGLEKGLGYLKSHHKFLGITMLVILSLYALIFIVAIFGATM